MLINGVAFHVKRYPHFKEVSNMKYIMFVDEWPVLVSKNYVFLFDTLTHLLKQDSKQTIIILNERLAYYV